MSDARAIKATFSTWRPVNGRKVLQLVFEVPIEQQGEVLTMLGAPDDKWCAIALLNTKPLEDSRGGAPQSSSPLTVPRPQADKARISPKPKRAFSDLPLSQQAALRCNDSDFFRFMTESFPTYSEGMALADFVRNYCGVDSRSELSTNAKAAAKWEELESMYQIYLLDIRYPEGGRR